MSPGVVGAGEEGLICLKHLELLSCSLSYVLISFTRPAIESSELQRLARVELGRRVLVQVVLDSNVLQKSLYLTLHHLPRA